MTISNLTADQISALRTLSQSDGLTIREREALQTILKPDFREMMENAPHGTAFKIVATAIHSNRDITYIGYRDGDPARIYALPIGGGPIRPFSSEECSDSIKSMVRLVSDVDDAPADEFKTVTVEGSDYWIIRTRDEAIRYASREEVDRDTDIVDRDGDDGSLRNRITFGHSDNTPREPWCLPWLVTKDGTDVELRNSYSDELRDIFRANRVPDPYIR